MNIVEFSKKIIEGVGGLQDFEYYEIASPNYSRDVSAAIWTIKCLANPKCEGSEEVLSAILERRKEIAAEHQMHLTGGTSRQNSELASGDLSDKAIDSPTRK